MVVRSSDPEIEALRKEHPCPACRARGYTSVSTMKADPGAIRRTGTGGMHVPLDEKPQEIADLEAAMDARLSYINRVVLVAKYVAFPRDRAYNPEMDGRKARVAWVNQAIRPEKISDGGMETA